MLLPLLLFASAVLRPQTPAPPCTASECYLSQNFTWDTAGVADTRQGAVGTFADVNVISIPFENVPAGYRVEIDHVAGDEIMGPGSGANFTPGRLMAYGLVGLTTSTPVASPYAPYSSMGCFLYKQSPISPEGNRIPIDDFVHAVLNADSILEVKQALFLSRFQVPIHFEATLVIWFRYLKPLE